MTDSIILPKPIQRIIIMYVEDEVINLTRQDEIDLRMLMWLHDIVRFPKSWLSVNNLFTDSHKWFMETFQLTKDEYMIIFANCCARNRIDQAKVIKQLFTITKSDYLEWIGKFYIHCYFDTTELFRWLLEELNLTEKESRIITYVGSILRYSN